ncbi:MAG: chromosome segregation protein SMC [Ardenticatenia bacterium]|nr:MAG: chromosome segregation protein SMC [Ardenticatenia bacterium]
MRLKTLELQGYKSFATKTIFHFDSGITAIVGPNGSGKSNVADAIRWVLGEQSYTALRVRKTEDLIFSGSESRPRLGLATVTLVLDNRDGWLPVDFLEVTITRRASRDGQNEYLLNGNRVRLRDITELLAAGGLGQRTYLHIGQGLVDATLSLRPEERRALVEDAAGIGLHHARRTEALARLDATQANLVRLHDILSEIEPRLKQLERQAERARAHQLISTNLRELLRIWYGYQWHQAQQKLHQARQDEERDRLAVTAQAHKLEGMASEIAHLVAQQSAVRAQVGEWHRQSSALHTEAETLQRDLAVGEERVRLLSAQRDEILGEVEALERSRNAMQDKIEHVKVALIQAEEGLQAAQQRVQALDVRLEEERSKRKNLLEQQRRWEQRVRQLTDQIVNRNARLQHLQEQIAQLEREAAQAIAAYDAHLHAHSAMEHQLQEKTRTAQELEGVIADLHRRIEEQSQRGHQMEQELGRAKDALDVCRRQLEALRARHDLLTRMQRDLTGYYEGVRAVLSAAHQGQLQGVLGTVAQLLHVPAPVEIAIETALGGHLQDIVVETWADAEAAIEYLKATRKGRATFLPLDTVHPSRPITLAGHDSKVLGVGSTLVTCAERLRPVLQLLLGRTIVVEDLTTARRVLRSVQGNFQIVTLAGELVRSGGSVTGGSVGGERSVGLLTRRREWLELPSAIQAHQATEEELSRRLEECRSDLTQAQAALQQMRQEATELETQRRVLERESAALAGEMERIMQAAAWQRDLAERAQTKRAELIRLVEHTKAEIELLRAEQQNAQSESEQLTKEVAALSQETSLAEMSQAQAALTAAQAQVERQRALLEGDMAALSEIEDRMKNRRARAEELMREIALLTAQLGERRERLTHLAEQISALSALIAPAEAELDELSGRQSALEEEERRQRERLRHLESEHARSTLELTRCQDALRALRRQIESELGLVDITLSEGVNGQPPLPLHPLVSTLPVVDEIPEDLEAEIRGLRVQLSQLGSVNLNAPQEYAEVRTRYEFLKGQISDLEQAAANLRRVIAELDQLIERDFLATFHAVSREFKAYFRRLFNGGDADLVLTDPQNISQTGIDIIARPPGKRARTLAMLSGGERALTAVSLIFALLKVRPTPFCTLDEVDAMLDEANVGRFRQVLEELSQQTQFIVITHNRHTVEAAKTIYGISMGKDTVSRVVSLRLEEVGSQ